MKTDRAARPTAMTASDRTRLAAAPKRAPRPVLPYIKRVLLALAVIVAVGELYRFFA